MFFFEKKTREPPKLGYARFGEPLYTKKLLISFAAKLRANCVALKHNT